jgi:hypothetical protein
VRTSTDTPGEAPSLVVGWREWLAFPDLGLPAVRAKVDTGASTSALHAHRIRVEDRAGTAWVRFVVHPFFRRHNRVTVACEAPVVDERAVTSSSGHAEHRVVIRVLLRLGVRADAPAWPVEVTLTDRRKMRFPMLLGREAMAGRVVVDPGASFLLGTLDRASDLYDLPGA